MMNAPSQNGAPQVVVAGHLCLDIIPGLGHVRLKEPADFFVPGKLLVAGSATISTGGPVSNTGLNLIKLGIPAALMGKVGADPFGELVRGYLKDRWGVTEGMIVDPDVHTSYTVVISPGGQDRMFLHHPGANDTFSADDIDYGLVGRTKLFHFGYPPLMARMYGEGGQGLAEVFGRVRKLGVTTSLDMSLPDLESASGKANWQEILKKVLPLVDVFLPSAEETLLMLEVDTFRQWRTETRGHLLDRFSGDDLHRLSGKLLDMGVAIAAIKCGFRGFYVRTANAARLKELKTAPPGNIEDFADREFWHPTYHVDCPPNATGSGDSSIAGFYAAYLRGLPLDECVRRAVSTGAANVTRPDALSGVKPWPELTAALDGGWQTDPLEVAGKGWRRDRANPRVWRGPAERK